MTFPSSSSSRFLFPNDTYKDLYGLAGSGLEDNNSEFYNPYASSSDATGPFYSVSSEPSPYAKKRVLEEEDDDFETWMVNQVLDAYESGDTNRALPPKKRQKTNKELLPHDTPDTPAYLRALKKEIVVRSHIADPVAREELDRLLGKYARPSPPPDYPREKAALELYLLDIDYYAPFWIADGSPVLRIYGVTLEGYSAVLYVQGFCPYFYARVNPLLAEQLNAPGADKDVICERFSAWVDERVGGRDPRPDTKRVHIGKYMRSISFVNKRSVFGYEKEESLFMRIETMQPRHVPLVRDLLQGKTPKITTAKKIENIALAAENEPDVGIEDRDMFADNNEEEDPDLRAPAFSEDAKYGVFEVFEADIQFTMNFMVSKNLKGCGWLKVPFENLEVPKKREAETQLEYRTWSNHLESLPNKNDVPPLRTVSIDIECAGKDGRFPKPEEDPIICISAMLYVLQDGIKPLVSVGFAVGTVKPPTPALTIQKNFKASCCGWLQLWKQKMKTATTKKKTAAAEVMKYVKIEFGRDKPVIDPVTGEWNREAEIDMILGYHRFTTVIADPDLRSGFNSDNFDDPYILHRADYLGIGSMVRRLGRLKNEIASMSKSTFSSNAFGTRTNLDTRVPGRINWDVLRVSQRELKLRSYTLNSIAQEILGRKKHDISHDRIGPSWLGPSATHITRRRILDYNVNDGIISYKVNAKKLWVWQYQELARATGVTIGQILNRGQGVKSLSQVLRAARDAGYVIPTFKDYAEKCIRTGFPEALRKYREEMLLEEKKKNPEKKVIKTLFTAWGSKSTAPSKKKDDEDNEGGADEDGAAYEGATVIDPILGFYLVPIATLDFSSLYPSIMIAWNLCWSTYTTKEQCEKLGYKERPKTADGRYILPKDEKGVYSPDLDGDYAITAAGHYFVTPKIRKGLMPAILISLLGRRKVAKNILAAVKKAKDALFAARKSKCSDDKLNAVKELQIALEKCVKTNEPTAFDLFEPSKQEIEALLKEKPEDRDVSRVDTLCEAFESYACIFDSRQNALKISANSMYGYTGASVSSLPLKAVAESVTAEGRVAIEIKRKSIECEFPMPDDLTQFGKLRPIVIGGDTDSIFIIFPGCNTPALCMFWAKEAAKWINAKFFTSPMETVFEKIYFPAIYLAPKRYAGRYWEKPDAPNQVPKPGGKDGDTCDRVDTKGAENVRRDNCLLVSETVGTVFRKILTENDPLGAAACVASVVDDIRTGAADLSKLIISKSLSKEPEEYPNLAAHVELAKRMKVRDPSTAPRVGDRVPYILVQPKDSKNPKMYDCGEDPKFVLDNDVPIYTEKYIEMLRSAVKRVLEPVLPGVTKLIFEGCAMAGKALKNSTIGAMFSRKKDEHIVLDHTDPEAKELLKKKKVRYFSDNAASNETLKWARAESMVKISDVEAHINKFLNDKHKVKSSSAFAMKRIVTTVSSASPLFRLGAAKIVAQCVSCKGAVPEKQPKKEDAPPCKTCKGRATCDCEERVGAPAFCKKCVSKLGSSSLSKYLEQANKSREEAVAKNDEKWEICRDCVGSIEDSRECGFKECGRFWS